MNLKTYCGALLVLEPLRSHKRAFIYALQPKFEDAQYSFIPNVIWVTVFSHSAMSGGNAV